MRSRPTHDNSRTLEPDATDKPLWWRRGLPGLATAALLLVGKLKFLLLGLTKASTFVSMFAFFGCTGRSMAGRWRWASCSSIYVHEMGHVAMLRRLGIDAGAPMFIPGVGAFVMLKQQVTDPLTDAKIGLAGPVWGLGAALVAVGRLRGDRRADLARDRAAHRLSQSVQPHSGVAARRIARPSCARATASGGSLVAAIALAALVTEQRLLLIVGGVAIWRALQQDAGPGDRRVLATFVVLVLALSFLARGVA